MKGDCIELPDAKTGGRIVPLGPEARAVLSALPREDDNPWVIAGKMPGTHLTDLQRPWRRIRARAGLEDVDRVPARGVGALRSTRLPAGRAGTFRLPRWAA